MWFCHCLCFLVYHVFCEYVSAFIRRDREYPFRNYTTTMITTTTAARQSDTCVSVFHKQLQAIWLHRTHIARVVLAHPWLSFEHFFSRSASLSDFQVPPPPPSVLTCA